MTKILTTLLVLSFPFSAHAFSDVSTDSEFYQAITYVQEQGIVSGYPDNTYQPSRTINRAEFTKIIMEAMQKEAEDSKEAKEAEENCVNDFSDVSPGTWFTAYVCSAKESGIIEGYPDGTFKPAQEVNFVEAAKMITVAFGLLEAESLQIEADKDTPWYTPYIQALAEKKAIPVSISTLDAPLNRGAMAEIIWRLHSKQVNLASKNYTDLVPATCIDWVEPVHERIDMEQVRNTWLDWLNDAREKEGLHPYTRNPRLTRTATIWSHYSKDRGEISHRRKGQVDYYDYDIITAWFAEHGLVFKNINRITYSENIGYGVFQCSLEECTDTLIQEMRLVFDAYLAEKDKESQPHFSSIMNPEFRIIGMGIAIDEETERYYITTHYGTEIVSDPLPICGS